MANPEHVEVVKQGAEAIGKWWMVRVWPPPRPPVGGRERNVQTKNNLLTQIKKVVPSRPKDHNVSTSRQVELNPLLFELHQTTSVHFTRRCCVLV